MPRYNLRELVYGWVVQEEIRRWKKEVLGFYTHILEGKLFMQLLLTFFFLWVVRTWNCDSLTDQ